MAEIKNFPNNSDEYIGAEYVMKWLHGRTSGVFGAENNLAVTLDSGMTVKVSDGVGWLSNSEGDGSVFWNDTKNTTGSELKLTAAIANAVNPRIDRVVVTWDTVDYAAKPRIELLQGTPAASPAAPTLTNNTLKRQISLAQIYVAAAASKLTNANITDERLDKSVCGIVTDWVTVDTTTMNQQFTEYLTAIRKELSDLNAGTATMLKATYDPKGRAQDIFAYADSQGVHLYQHTKVGTVHKLTGSGPNGRVKLTANVAAGDTVQVNGKTVPAYVGAETFADALVGESITGRWLSFVWDGTQVNFKAGGGLSNTKLALADAEVANVRAGKKFYAKDKTIKIGTLTDAMIASEAGLTADKIMQGNTVLGIAGSGRLAQNVGIWAVIGGYDHEGDIRVGGFTYSTDWVTLSHTGTVQVRRNNVTLTATLKKTGYWRIDNWSIGENYGNWTYPTGGTYRYDAGTVIKLQLNWNDVEVCCGCTIIQYQGQ